MWKVVVVGDSEWGGHLLGFVKTRQGIRRGVLGDERAMVDEGEQKGARKRDDLRILKSM